VKPSLLALLVLASPLLVPPAQAGVLRVPQQFPSIQAAVDAALPGDSVVVSKGLYKEAVSLSGKQQLVLQGLGVVRLDSKGLGVALSLSGCSSVSVRDLKIVGADGVAVLVDSCLDVKLSEVSLVSRLPDSGADSMQVRGSSGVSILRCEFKRSQAEGALDVGFGGAPVDDLKVKGCVFVEPLMDAVRLDQVQGAVIEHNVARRPGLCFVSVWDSVSDVQLRRNKVVRPGDAGIVAIGSGVVADHNLVSAGMSAGVYLLGDELVASDNRILSVAGQGLLLLGSEIEASYNRVSGCGENGITVDGLDMDVSDNVVSGVMSTGIQVTGSQASVERNKVSAAQLHGLYVNAVGSDVNDNIVLGDGVLPLVAGMLVVGNGMNFSGNLVSGAGFDGIVLAGNNGQVSGNEVSMAMNNGLSLQGSGSVLTGNSAFDSGNLDLFELQPGQNSIDDSNSFGSSNAP
jgi:hypothetical protein